MIAIYQVLYRKYRPKNFNEVTGQNNIVTTLKNSIKNNKIGHAYIFFGPRGTGKTTFAKIFARSINCLEPNDGSPCGKCVACQNSVSNECLDIIEIDAASNNGVDEIRELKSKINFLPSSLNYKVYIIDEVHMLSIGAFNALLKTIEEPPEHVVFILATTDFGKVPETIISRCQTFSFERIANKNIFNKLKEISEKEKIEIEDEVLENIALYSNGGMRDSLGMLDKLSAYCNNKITIDDFLNLNFLLSKKELNEFLNDLVINNNKEIIKKINTISNQGKNFIQISTQLLYEIINQLENYYLNKSNKCFNKKLEALANTINGNILNMKNSSNPKIYFEILLLNFLDQNDDFFATDEKEKNIKKINNNLDDESLKLTINTNNMNSINSNKKLIPIDKSNLEKQTKINSIRINNTFANANKEILQEVLKKYQKLNEKVFDQTIGYLTCELMDGTIRVASSENIIISYENNLQAEKNLNIINKLSNVLRNCCEIHQKIAIISDEKWEKLKQEYIKNKKNGIMYEYIEEPNEKFESTDTSAKNIKVVVKQNDDENNICMNDAVNMFGDLVQKEK